MQAQGHEAFVQCELAHVAPISWTSLNIDTYYWVSREKQVQSISSATTWETEKCGWQRRLKLPPEVFAKTLNVTGSICRTELLPNSEGSTHQGGRWRTADAEIWEPEKSENVSSCVIASNCAIIGSRSFILQAFPTSSNQEHQARHCHAQAKVSHKVPNIVRLCLVSVNMSIISMQWIQHDSKIFHVMFLIQRMSMLCFTVGRELAFFSSAWSSLSSNSERWARLRRRMRMSCMFETDVQSLLCQDVEMTSTCFVYLGAHFAKNLCKLKFATKVGVGVAEH